MIPAGRPYFKVSIEGLGIQARAESYNELREKLTQEVVRKRERARKDEAALTKVYLDLITPE